MKIKGYSTGLYGWQVKYWAEGKEPSMEEIFRECAEAGLDAVEIDPVPETAALARSFGLSVSGSYAGLPLHEPIENLRIEETLLPIARRLAENGGRDLVINADPKGGWDYPLDKTEDEFKRQGDNLTRIALAVNSLGLAVSMHNHAASLHNAEGDLRSVIEYGAREIGLCIDTGWAHIAGCDPIGWIRKYPERVTAFHLRNQTGLVPAEDLAEGDIDMRKLLGVLDVIGFQGWLTLELFHPLETQAKRTLMEDVRRSVEFLKESAE
ncbi:sugar phosphate isomerase/epimerase family protein [Cohnella luojiensis]|uniref:Sugar phosphate isomerase/epimerase n=1 Tax=Cohnella luojiensis TaxID=652876 RepID=A0A4Y8LZA4_9BACL|nr:sugar phosphate isomerase/epimerase [Cohnella luojiensis]TFE26281.1 sugar phosphate isomerase/epimerase [Cohnella luojiensis]